MAANGVLYGPANIPAGGGAAPRTAWTPQSQTSSGAGTSVNPYRVVTVVTGGPVRVTQTDSYVVGDEAYATRIQVENTSGSSLNATVYRAGDCYLQNSDSGYGRSDAVAGSVACVTGQSADSRIEQWAPLTPGSRFFESSYSAVWSWIGTRQPFPNTSADATYQDNGAGLSWTTAITSGGSASFSHLTAFSPDGSTEVSDSDGDGLPDSWESSDGGVDTNGDGTPDLKLSDYGATPNTPDLFVQVNWTQTRSCAILTFFCSTVNRRPSLAALGDVQAAFKRNGIRLHIDAGADSIMNPDTGASWGSLSQVHGGVNAPSRIPGWDDDSEEFNWSAYDAIRNQVVSAERTRIFHTALYVGSFNGGSNNRGNSGLARNNGSSSMAGRDFMVATGVAVFGDDGTPGMSRIEESGTFMHELGHTLGLSHGGSYADRYIGYKPNYPSVMNYFWQLGGTYKASTYGLLDYSEGTLNSVNENSLSEADGLGPDSAAGDISTSWFCPNGTKRGPSPSVFDVDWNCSNGIDGSTVSVDLNSDSTRQVLTDHNDWTSLIFDGSGALGGAGVPSSAPATTPGSEEPATAADLVALAPDLQSVRLTLPGQILMQTGTTSPLALKIENQRDSTLTYDLTSISSGITLGGLPSSVTLSAGEERSIPLTITADGVTDSAFFEVDASQGSDPSNTGAAVTEVYVVNERVADQPGVGPICDAVGPVTVTANTPRQLQLSCTDSNGQTMTLSKVASPAHGTLGAIDSATQTVTYTPAPNYLGPDSFSYRAATGPVTSEAATVSLNVVSAVTCSGRMRTGSNSGSSFRGGNGADWFFGGAGRDTIIGGAGSDCLYGQGNNDTVNGEVGNDIVAGGDGNDSLNAGPGQDDVRGGAGDDTIYAADDEKDAVDCGTGRDVAVVDAFDVVTNCERKNVAQY